MDDYDRPKNEPIADADLVLRTRSGDSAAFGELWQRHYPSGLTVARAVTSSIDPDDLVQESYTRIYQAILKGGGPNGSFRAYLFTSIRNTAAAWGRARRESPVEELDSMPDPASSEQAASDALDRSLTARAFRSLPARWQEVLWYTEIEQMKPQEVGPLLGMKAGAVSQLAFRAREGLREAWIQAHLRDSPMGSECNWTIERLGAHSRGNLGVRDQKKLNDHLAECARCMIVAAEARDVSQRLALVLLPLVLGVSGSAGYLATLGKSAALAPVAAMPSSVTNGAALADGAINVAPTSSGASTSSESSGGALNGVGAVVGAGSAVLIVAGVVAAATIIPGLTGAQTSTSSPSSSESDSSSITSTVGPDESIESEKAIAIEQQPPPPTTPPAPEPAPRELRYTPVSEGSPESDAPPATRGLLRPPRTPVHPPNAAVPDGTPRIGAAQFMLVIDIDNMVTARYLISVAGVTGARVGALIGGSVDGTETVTLVDHDGPTTIGSGTIELTTSIQNICDDVPVEFFYTSGSLRGDSVVTTLRDLSPERSDVLCGVVEVIDELEPDSTQFAAREAPVSSDGQESATTPSAPSQSTEVTDASPTESSVEPPAESSTAQGPEETTSAEATEPLTPGDTSPDSLPDAAPVG